MKGLVFSVLAIAAAVAFLAPHMPQEPAKPEVLHVAGGPDKTLAVADKPDWYGGDMTFTRSPDGHFYAPVRIDTRDYRMLVDTGASVVALTGEDARDIGLDWDPGDLAPVARGASGAVMGVPVTIDDIAVGDFEAHDVPAVIIPDGLAVSLLGQSFLRHVGKVDISDNTLTLGD